MGQVGIPLFYLQHLAGMQLKFRDLFNDESQYWAWRLYLGEISEVGKSGWETTGRYFLQVNNLTNGQWNNSYNEAPRLFMGILSYPCEVITRLDTFTGDLYTNAGLFISKDAPRFGGNNYLAIIRRVTSTQDGVAVVNTEGLLAWEPITDLPMWLRLRIGCTARYSLNVYFDYSLDGVNWTNLWVQNIGYELFSVSSASVGLYVSNTATDKNLVTASFDHFIMRPRSIN